MEQDGRDASGIGIMGTVERFAPQCPSEVRIKGHPGDCGAARAVGQAVKEKSSAFQENQLVLAYGSHYGALVIRCWQQSYCACQFQRYFWRRMFLRALVRSRQGNHGQNTLNGRLVSGVRRFAGSLHATGRLHHPPLESHPILNYLQLSSWG